MYSKFDRIENARSVFDGMTSKNEASWNNMLSGYVRVGFYPEAMRFFRETCEHGIKPSGFMIASLVTACDRSACMFNEAFQVHGCVIKCGLLTDVYVGTSLVHFYGSCGLPSNAQKLFDEMTGRNVVSWTSLMVAYSDNGNTTEVISIYQRLRREGVSCNENTIATVFSSCGMLADELLGYQVLAHVIKYGLETNVSAANSLIYMFGSWGNDEEASSVFDQMRERDRISWNSMISVNARNGMCESSFRYFHQMRHVHSEVDPTTLSIMLSVCGSVDNLKWGRGIHSLIVKSGLELNVFLSNTLLNMYSEAGRLEDAEFIFEKLPDRDLVSWNSILACYVQDEKPLEALKIFSEILWMRKEINYVSFTSALAACSNTGFLPQGKKLHGLLILAGLQDNIIVCNSLITMYGKTSEMVEAKKVFWRMPKRDRVTWNALIGGYADNEEPSEAVKAFNLMRDEGVHADYITLANLLSACLTTDDLLKYGRSIHAHTIVTGFEVDNHVQSSLITMYAKCGDLSSSGHIFDHVANKSSTVWNAIIIANAHQGLGEEALKLVVRKRNDGTDLDQFSFSGALSAAADLAMLEEGQQLHGLAVKMGYISDHFVANAAMDMYGKCGELADVLRMLPSLISRSRLSWNTLISAYARHGHFQQARDTFHEMVKLAVRPDHVTFVCLLSACSHGGLVDEGLGYFASMMPDFGVPPGIEHCVCIIDLLGRSGRLTEAETFIQDMPVPPNDIVWRSLLASCKIHRNLELGRKAADRLLDLDSSDDSAYVLYSNVFASTGRWDAVETVRRQMESNSIKKKPACSWVKLKSTVTKFGMGDRTHPEINRINAKLSELMKLITEAGYVPDTSFSLQDTDEEQKEQNLWNHSERIALAFGLLNAPEGSPVRIFKNLRVCGDCHTVFKLVSRIVGRNIILRDPYRFHHFSGGHCSCLDYW